MFITGIESYHLDKSQVITRPSSQLPSHVPINERRFITAVRSSDVLVEAVDADIAAVQSDPTIRREISNIRRRIEGSAGNAGRAEPKRPC